MKHSLEVTLVHKIYFISKFKAKFNSLDNSEQTIILCLLWYYDGPNIQ